MSQEMVRVAVDGMGGDFAPAEVVKGALLSVQENPELELILVGEKENLERELKKGPPTNKIKIEKATESIAMGEAAPWAVRSKENSSITVGLRLLQEGPAQAFVSAGHTGAVMSAALFILGRIKGILRPAIAVVIPVPKGPFVLLDAGANPECKAENLLQFAKMGEIYARQVLELSQPAVSLLNIGAEKSKGDSLYQSAYLLLEESGLNFKGNIEGGDLPLGRSRVVVSDGFTGNVVLKLIEGTIEMIFSELKEVLNQSFSSRLGKYLISPTLNRLHQNLDYEEYGGAELLGVKGVCVICHGSSKAKAIKNGIKVAAKSVRQGVVKEIEKNFS